jgi:hypothetical protein
MPNWCNNTITITGDVETLSQLKPVIAAGEGLLQAIKPMPKELEGTTAPSDTPNWYDWCTATINGWFDTAWGPPIEAFQTLVDDWDSCYIELMYEESGMCFVGCFDSEGGDDYYEYSEATSKTIKDIVPAYLVDAFALDERLAEYEEEEAAEELAN